MQSGDFTNLLHECAGGNKGALDALTPIVCSELRLVRRDLPDFQSRAHFFGVAAHVMRQILIAGALNRDEIPVPAAQRTRNPFPWYRDGVLRA